jgi:hypothetical protein
MSRRLPAARSTVPSTALPASRFIALDVLFTPQCAGIGLERRAQACSFGLWNGIKHIEFIDTSCGLLN